MRRAIVVLLSAQGQTVRDITSLLQVSEDYVRPWLNRTRALVLDTELSVVLGRHRLTHDNDLGLIVERTNG
jgi:transposase